METHLDYLARDVAHLEALDDLLWRELADRGIEAEVLEETRYRLATAMPPRANQSTRSRTRTPRGSIALAKWSAPFFDGSGRRGKPRGPR